MSALRIFSRIAKSAGADRVYPIAGGSSFLFDGVTYEVLWPDREGYPFSELFASAVEQLNVCLASPFLPEAARRFLELKARYGKAYDACCQSSPLRAEGIAQLDALLEQIDALLPELHLLPTAPDVVQILTDPGTTAAYSDELNAASVIFHNRRTKEASLDDILMTGDAAPESFDVIAGRLYRDYYIVKAPPPWDGQPLEPLACGDFRFPYPDQQRGVSKGWQDCLGIRGFACGEALHQPRRLPLVCVQRLFLQPRCLLLRSPHGRRIDNQMPALPRPEGNGAVPGFMWSHMAGNVPACAMICPYSQAYKSEKHGPAAVGRSLPRLPIF